MLSNKLTFSLTSLVVLLAFGLAFVPSVADAAEWWQYQPEVELSVTDVSNADGNQVEAYAANTLTPAAGETPNILAAGEVLAGGFEFYLKVTKGQASVNSEITGATADKDTAVADQLDLSDLRFTLLDKDGVIISEPDPMADDVSSYIGLFGDAAGTMIDPVHDDDVGRNFKVIVTGASYTSGTGDTAVRAAAVLVHLPAGSFRNIEPTAVAASLIDKEARRTGTNKKAPEHNLPIILVAQEPPAGNPEVVSTVRIVETATRAVSRFQEARVSGPFQVRITLTEEGHNFASADGTTSDYIQVLNGTLTRIVPGVPFAGPPPDEEGGYTETDTVPLASGRDRMYHPYLITIDPDLTFKSGHENRARNVEIRVKAFNDLVIPPNGWVPPTNYSLAVNRSLLEVPINPGSITADIFKPAEDARAANEVFIPDGAVIPGGGYLVITQGDAAQSGVTASPDTLADKKTDVQKAYNVRKVGFPYPGNDLEALFRIGGTIRLIHNDVAANTAATGATANDKGYLVSNNTYTTGSVVISEIMWGRDASLGSADATKSQWIELYNPGTDPISIDKNEWKLAFYQGSGGTAGTDVIDEVSNVGPPYWPAPGNSGATEAQRRVDVTQKGKTVVEGTDEIAASVFENFNLSTVASMYRKIDGTDVMSGTSKDSWAGSTTTGTRNLSGLRAGTPGAATPYEAPPPPVEEPPPPPPMAPPATASDLAITEIMVASNAGKLPQWIEIKNTSVGEVSLDGWRVSIANDPDDADVVASTLSIKLDGVTLDANQVALVVSKTGRNSGVAARAPGDDNTGDLDSNRIVNAHSMIKPASPTYSMLSEMSFRISLEPPLPLSSAVTDRGDVVGNLGRGWELPMSEAGRSSIIRREMNKAKTTDFMGTDEAGWKLASDTSLLDAYIATYYGHKDDKGTPGYDARGALPVELSKFGAKRDPLTGQVIVTWETQSELNNAGFFIKRSQQKNAKFVAVNPTMIPGAGTTSEKQTYTYTDTTAQPNIVYYYQIEDVSLDGQRQTLTRAHRLKGHVGAAGKLTTLWGELKEQQ